MQTPSISIELAEQFLSATVEPVRLSSGDWAIRVFDSQLRRTVILSSDNAPRIEREVHSLGAQSIASRIRSARQVINRRRMREAIKGDER